MTLARTTQYLLLSLCLAPACDVDEDGVTDDLEQAADLDDPSILRDSLARPLGPVSRDIVIANQAADEQFHLLARVEVQPGELLEIYEPRPGVVIVSAAGAPSGAPRLTAEHMQGMPVSEVWAAMTEDAEMPPALAETLARTGDGAVDFRGAASAAAAPVAAGADSFVAPRETLGGGYCDNAFFSDAGSLCEDAVHAPDVTVCLDNWYNGAWAESNDSYWTTSTVCPAQGSVAMRLQTEYGDSGLWTVAQNTYRTWTRLDGSCLGWFDDCPWVRVDIEQASGDRFHFRYVSNEG